MTDEDRRRWDATYAAERDRAGGALPGPPDVFEPYRDLFPTSGHALELACGRGTTSVWLAVRGLDVLGVDVSPVALSQARDLAARFRVSGRCRFETADLDLGLPAGPPAAVIVCHMFRDERLDRPVMERLTAGGLLAVAARSQAGATGSGRYRAAPGELRSAFAGLSVLAHGEGEGRAWLLARK